MTKPTVSLIVPTFNRARYLRSSIASLVAQTHAFDELLIIDDGSTDETPEVVKELPGRPTYLRKENGGRAAAINFGVRQAKGDLVWIFDDDDIALPNSLELLIAPFLEPGSQVDFTYSPWYLCDENADGSLRVAGTSNSPLLSGDAFFHEMLFRCFTQGNAMLIAKRCYDRIGPMREDLIRSQDHEYMLRLGRSFSATPIDQPTFYWRRHLGPRGAGAGKMFRAAEMNRQWHVYRQKIFVEVHDTFSLVDYLPMGRKEAYPGNTREARLTRAVVMACHGLWMLALPELLDITSRDPKLEWSEQEAAVVGRLSMSMSTYSLFDLSASAELPLLKRIAGFPLGRPLVDSILRGGRWVVHNHVRDSEHAFAARVAGAMLKAVGPREALRSVMAKMRA